MGLQRQPTKSFVIIRLSPYAASASLADFTLSFLPISYGNATKVVDTKGGPCKLGVHQY